MPTYATFYLLYLLSYWSLQGSLPLSNSSETLIAVDSGDDFIYLALKGGPILKISQTESLVMTNWSPYVRNGSGASQVRKSESQKGEGYELKGWQHTGLGTTQDQRSSAGLTALVMDRFCHFLPRS